MKQQRDILRGRPWLMLLLLFAWLLPQEALADRSVDKTMNYQVMLSGSNSIRIKAPIYDEKWDDHWISNGNLNATWKDKNGTSHTVTVLYWAWNKDSEKSHDNDKSELTTRFRTDADGSFLITKGNSPSQFTLTKGDNQVSTTIYENSDETYEFSADWRLPYDMLGCDIEFSWDVKVDYTNGLAWDTQYAVSVSKTSVTVPPAAATVYPQVTMAMLAYNSPGVIEVPWFMASDKIKSAKYVYVDYKGNTIEEKIDIQKNGTSILLDATQPHKNFRVIASYEDGQGNYIDNVSSDPQDLKMVHVPVGLSARPLGDKKASVQLDWSIMYPEVEDISSYDAFEIQRSLTGKEEDFETIHSEPYVYDPNESSYTFIDSTLVEAIVRQQLKQGGTLDSLTYRVRRSMTESWGWNHVYAPRARCVVDDIHLLRIATYSAKWEDERAFTARVDWEYANEYNSVWDERAKLTLNVTQLNQAGDTVGVQDYILNAQEREQRYKVIELSRTCVNYKVKMFVDRGTSEIPLWEEITPFWFPIRNADDWKEFRNRVQVAGGKYDVNARLYADVDAGSIMVSWESGYAYRGTFDGNGHTLTFNVPDHGVELLAPFRYVGNATIKNLHTAGTIKSSIRYVSGLVGKTMEGATVNIENCRSSMTLNSTVNGEGLLAGIIARLSASNVVIRNTKVDGSFEGENAYCNCGFVAWVARGSNLSIENCLFAPDHIITKLNDCHTWVNLDNQNVNYSNLNSYATREYSGLVIIRNAGDWHNFAVMVNNAVNQYWVDARLEADITISEHVGVTAGATYRGTFDGNGHTITFNKDGFTERFIAPFRYVGDATIKNLKVKGSISSSQMYATGLVAHVLNGTATIENCQSSVTVKGTMDGEGCLSGFVGRVTESKVTIRNCKFDGSFEGNKCYGNAGFISWVDEASSATIENCLFMPDHISTRYDQCTTWARKDNRGSLTITNSHSTKEYNIFPISSSADWDTFRTMITDAKGEYWVDAMLTADISTTQTAAWYSSSPYRGTFYGNGHTITVDINGGGESFVALFRYGKNYTIKDLHVKGTIKGGDCLAGLVGWSYVNNSADRNKISNCRVEVDLTTSSYFVGGFVGRGNYTDIANCRFDGSFYSSLFSGLLSYAGVFFGASDSDPVCGVQYCLEQGTNKNINSFCSNYRYDGRAWGNGLNEWCHDIYSYSNLGHAISVGSTSTNDLVGKLGSGNWENVGDKAVPKMGNILTDNPWYNGTLSAEDIVKTMGANYWEVVDGKAVPKMESAVISEASLDDLLAKLGSSWVKEGSTINPVTSHFADPTATYPAPSLPADNFYHEGNGEISKTLMTETRQSSVVLTWEVNGIVDYFQVYRRPAGKGDDAWQLVASDIDQTGYEDFEVSPLVDYEYMVRAVTDCEGKHYSETQVKAGSCKHTGRVAGYVRFNDGTGVPNIEVTAKHEKLNENDQAVEKSAKTDESGYFVIDGLPYNGLASIDYTVSPTVSDIVKYEDGKSQFPVTFTDETNDEQISEFTVINSHRFSGFVMYDGTSIPVKGARFKVDDYDVHNASGDFVETDYDGSFSFRVLDGPRRIQAVMDKHTFVDGGYFMNEKKEKNPNITKDESGIYFYDDTKVKLIGRIVGGTDQGEKPLDNNLSVNNLGRNLTMVLTLEGDNTSWLVYDNLNPEQKTRELTFPHARGNGHQTTAVVERKRMTVKPDSVTGEYTLKLPPVRWKVQQLYCDNFPTLFQEGQVSEVVDLTDCLTDIDTTYVGTYTDVEKYSVYKPKATYNAIYNRIYHTPVEITYRQVGYDNFDYFGDKSYRASTAGGITVDVPLAYSVKKPNWPTTRADSLEARYTFEYPVFSINRKYPIAISVAEHYPWDGVKGVSTDDVVRIGGGKVTVHNDMKNDLAPEVVELDSLGKGNYYLVADETVRLLTGENALKTVTMTLEQDGTTYEAEPLKGYTLNMFALGGSKDVLVNGQPVLIDILRDPPGGGSSATLSKGSTLKYNYTLDMSLKVGPELTFGTGTELQNFQGTVTTSPVGPGTTYGIINASDIENWFSQAITYDVEGHRAFSYTINVGQDIVTSSDQNMVGADADLYIGTVQNYIVQPMSTIRAIPDSIYQHMLGRLDGGNTKGVSTQYGTLVEIAKGYDADKNLYHLVRDESIGYGPKVQSKFIHSQKYILTELLPAKAKELRALMFTGTKAEAQTQANATGKPVYLSTVAADDENFGVEYEWILPTSKTEKDFTDEAGEIQNIIVSWLQMIALNEKEKLTAWDKLANYDVDGGTKVNYSETFTSEYSISNYSHFPGLKGAGYFENNKGRDGGFGFMSSILVPVIKGILQKVVWGALSKKASSGQGAFGSKENDYGTRINFYGRTYKFSVNPVFGYAVKDVSGESKAFSRKESFNIVMDKKSHLNFDVYRVWTDTASVAATGSYDVFSNQNFKGMTDYIEPFLKRNLNLQDALYSRSFIYRTNGGATVNPWEDARNTVVYESGRLLDERTKKIQNPKISLDRQSVSGVAMGKPARFKVYLTNDSENPEAATGGISLYNFYLDPASNPHGATVLVDGYALTSSGIDLYMPAGKVIEKTIEVYAGTEFDYEGLKIGIMSCSDPDHIWEEVPFDVHFLRQAGPVNISAPGDKWVMNTDASEDDKRGWFIPVTIDGFDKHQHNFDHIEFQYKESQRGDEYWTNLCSFYADSTLMAKASGEREMIPENGNITTNFYGEGVVMEKAYDLRAVLFCRNGNSFLTTSSKIISGVKDTRRPQLFGTPEPKSGLLTAGDNIIFNFSEDIEYNYLSAITNFEVKGETNNDHISENVSVQFTGKASVETEAKRNFSGKDLTIDMMILPDSTGYDMPLFSHGTNGQKLQLWLTKDFKLKAVVNDTAYVSDSIIKKNIFTQVAMTINLEEDSLKFFNGGKKLGSAKLGERYNGTGKLIFGRTNESDRMDSKYYAGRMMEARLWYRAMDGGLIGSTYGGRRLTGYEQGLVDYYPMNEGSGDYVIDKTQGANAKMMTANWAIPRGFSLRLENDDHGIKLTNNALSRTKDQDYTLMFWFKTDSNGRGVLVSNGAGTKEEIGAENIFNIAFEAEKLMFRSNGQAVQVPGDWSDNQWHHFAMTVNRGFNVANIYVDKELRTTFATDSLGGISGGTPLIGAALYKEFDAENNVVTIDTRNWLTGNIDEFCFFAQALPQTLIKTYASKSPSGDEAGMLTYLSFDRQERQKNNTLVTVAYPYSKKIYKDADGNIRYQLDPQTRKPTTTPMRDYVFVDTVDVILTHITDAAAAPVVPNEELENLNFSYVGEGHQLLVNVNEAASKLNHRNIYVTIRDIEDKRGNAMASPQTACYYVTNSSLEWVLNRMDQTIKYGSEEEMTLPFYNNSGRNHTYKIENCPKWLTLDKYTDVLAPQAVDYVTATVSKDLNIGTYNEIIYLTDEDGLSEPFYLNLTVEGETPEWAVSGDLLQKSMNIIGQVYLYDELDTDTRDVVGAFDNEGVCHGIASISHDIQTGETGLYLTVYDSISVDRPLNFRLWQYSTGREIVLTTKPAITFQESKILGTDTPVRFDGGDSFVQYFRLYKGWNWVSFNILSEKLFNLNNLLKDMSWTEGDIITELGGKLTLTYQNNQWLASGSTKNVVISPKKSYAIKVQKPFTFPIGGTVIKAKDERTITLKQGWNGIGYTPVANLSVETALSDYYDNAEDGDVIKSHTEFAYFTKTGNTGRWRGSLQYMKPGEGYMMLRKAAEDAKFTYPFYEPGSNFTDFSSQAGSRSAALEAPKTMTVSATVVGFETEEGDRLVAYANGEAVGAATVAVSGETADNTLYLSIAGDNPEGIWFAIEREGEIVASTSEVMTFKANAVVGSPDEPTAISFVRAEYEDGKWYTTNGLQLQNKPTRKGVYIFNGRKVVVK